MEENEIFEMKMKNIEITRTSMSDPKNGKLCAPADHMFTGRTYFKHMKADTIIAKIGYILTPRGRHTKIYIENAPPAKVGMKRDEWVRDLTRECVEPNPGPISRQSPLDVIREEEVFLDNGIYEYCYNCENTILLMDFDQRLIFYRSNCKFCKFEAQSMELFNDYQDRFKQWIWNGEHLGKSFLGRHLNITGKYDKEINLIEDVGLLIFQFVRSRNNADRCVAVVNFCKLRGMKFTFLHILLEIVDDLFHSTSYPSTNDIMSRMGFEAQEEDAVEYSFERMRQVLGSYEKLKEMAVYKKLHKLFMYLLCTGLLKGTSITFKSLQFDKFEEEALKRTHKPGFDMVHAMLDAVVFVCEAGYHFFKTGDATKFIHSGSSYEKWLATSQKLKMQSKFLSNPEPHGFNRFSYVAELKDTIEKGKSIVKFTGGLDRGEKLFLQKTLMELQMIEAEETTRRSAQQPRKDPFGILIHGSSHIAKSKLTEIMFKHYGKCFNLPIDDTYRYTRCPTDEYWSGFDSTQWCIVMDDIAFLAPTGEVDPTLKELLQVKNSVPYTPPQAALEDKGRTPVKAELLIATTNTKHLNLHAYFACPFAIARRLSFVVTPTVKEEYVKNGFMVDSKKIPPTPEGQYMNIWNFKVSVPMPESLQEKDNQRTRYEEIESFDDINSFLQWYIFAAEEHAQSQAKADAAAKSMAEVQVCMGCKRPQGDCLCGSSWPHQYAKCGVCEKLMGNCVCTDQVEVSDLGERFKFKLWYYSLVVRNSPLDFEMINNIVSNWMYLIMTLAVTLLMQYPFVGIITLLSVALLYNLARYAPCILAKFYMWKYGSLWKYRLLFKLCGNELDTWRLIFRICGEKIEKIQNKENYLYGLGALLALPVTLIALRSLWNTYIRNTEPEKEVEQYPKTREEALSRGFMIYEKGNVMTSEGTFTVSEIHNNPAAKKDIADMAIGESRTFDCGSKGILYDRVNNFVTQGNEGSIPLPMIEEKKTFYYHDPYATTECEISGVSKCAQGTILQERLLRQTATFNIRFPCIGRGSFNTAVNFYGNLWLLNKHAIKADVGEVDVIRESTDKNVSRNIYGVSFSKADLIEIPETDAVILQLRSLPPGKSLLDYFPLDTLLQGIYKGRYIMRDRSGETQILPVNNIRAGLCPVFGVPGYHGIAIRPTSKGDCGSMCICDVGSSQVILGMHTSGAPNGGVAMQHLSQKILRSLISHFESQVSEGEIPISAPGYERKLIDLHHKSCIRFLEKGTAAVYGSFAGYRPKHKSKVEPTYICDYVVKHGYKANFGPPCMDWKPWHLAIKDMTTPVHCYLNENIIKCENAFFNDICSKLGDKISMLEVYTLDVALNGAEGVTYVDKLNCSTSAGNPFKKSKKNFIEQIDGRIVKVDQVILDRISQIEQCYDNNTRFHPQFCGHLKDEPVSLKKIEAGKTRVFTGGEFAWSVVVRRYLLSHIRLIQNNPFIFEAMPGVVAQSIEWSKLYSYLIEFGEHKIIAGDYGKFDKRMAAPFILSAFRILERLAEKAGWPDSDLRYIRCIAHDTAFPCIDFNGDLIEIQGNPSGHPLTVIINCIVNSLYMRYAYMLISGKDVTTFQDYVHLATYGDDNIMGVSDDCPNFTHTRIAMAMKCIGVEYTMAEKEAQSVPYIHINDASFLKRAFRFDKDIGCIVAPLDESSFHKMLTARLPKDDMAPEAHTICVVETAIREYFFHGKEVFDDRVQFFKQLVIDCDLECWVRDSTFPNYYSLVYDFWMKYDDVESAMKYSLGEHTPQSLTVNAPFVCAETTVNRPKVLSAERTYDMIGQSLLGRGLRVKSTCCTLQQDAVSVPNPVRSVSSSSSIEEEEFECYKSLGSYLWQSQSAEIILDETKAETQETVEGLVTFMERQDLKTVGLTTNSVLGSTTVNTHIASFFARPVRINVFTWNESDVGARTNFNPWTLWATTASVQNKLANYAFFRGDLKLKIQISASPFYYGLMLANYRPLTGFKGDTIYHGIDNTWKIGQSQRPHVKIDPANGDTYEMVLPFLYPYNMFPLQTASLFDTLGNFRFDIYSNLQSANGVSGTGITVTTYAWIENIELSGATAGYAAQSDEYGTGVVSKPASWVADIAGRLESVPVIGTFATATRLGATAIGAIASLFGFTNVPVISDTEPVRVEAFPKFANCETGFPVEKLTLDPKNELSVDPRIFGMPDGKDEMAISHIVQRESYLTMSTWSTADSPGTIKFSTLVTPNLYDTISITGALVQQLTPMAWLSNMFQYWRGDIVITLRVIASKYHKGKLKISFDPSGYGTGINNILTNDNTANIVQTSILDIGENREVEFTIPYQQYAQFLKIGNYGGGNPWSTSASPSLTHDATQDNGFFTVRVQNALTAPVLSSSVDILIFVRAGENFEFAAPDEIDSSHQASYFSPQSDEYICMPINGKVVLGNVNKSTDNQYLVHFGEQVVSLRTVLHRFNRLSCDRVAPSGTANTYQVIEKICARLPMTPGYVSTGYSTANKQATGTYGYNFCTFTALAYVANAYIGYRGGVNYTFNVANNVPVKNVVAFRAPNTQVAVNSTTTVVTSNSQLARAATSIAGSAGSALTNQLTQSGLNVMMPMFTQYKFLSTDITKGNVPGSEDPEMLSLKFDLAFPTTTISDSVLINTYVAAAPDFTLLYFINAPSIYIYGTYPAAV
ncbi:hypothetical protein [Beihai picorna-like virus 48]|uniref:hypothetical protein n=1 Tax=Beihai picorna-like virus 48 TaxID=1922592 RepID=UPI00090CD11F|nr:hypothetical protein [Beihai picorna-like virus 48]APG78918.1 hypothetical protein [Beihai picorna-like virus 48]